MHASHAPTPAVGYCTNVHAGTTFDETLANLQQHALAVKQQVSPDAPMGVGLWLSAEAARGIISADRIDELRQFLDTHGLYVFTLNGFPYGDFHAGRVKHRVYEPSWADRKRLNYTLDLVRILTALLPEGGEGGISTLPIGWPSMMDAAATRVARDHLLELVHQLARAELDSGKLIHVDLEPEPGCVMSTGDQAVAFFREHLLGHADDLSVKAYLRICHDICHAAVMFEDQAEALRRYAQAGLGLGKVQVSSAVRVAFDELSDEQRDHGVAALRQFAEDRYLHQTCVRDADGKIHFFEDLPDALSAHPPRGQWRGEWRVHFHVPIYLDGFGHLATTRDAIDECLPVAQRLGVRAFEAETYAWPVLPAELRVDRLADGIARELVWLHERMGTP